MTCIVGVVQNGEVFIGGDSAGTNSSYDQSIRTDEKVFKKGDMVFGFTTSFRMGQILRYCFKIPDHDPRIDDYEYLCSTFIDELMKCFKEKWYNGIKEKDDSGGTFIVGYKGNLYKIYSDFQVEKTIDKYSACGCGEPYAFGALKATESIDEDPFSKIQKALEVAEYFSAGVKGPFNFVSTVHKNT